jgi:hypothetical protein
LWQNGLVIKSCKIVVNSADSVVICAENSGFFRDAVAQKLPLTKYSETDNEKI